MAQRFATGPARTSVPGSGQTAERHDPDDDRLQLGPLNNLLGYRLAHAVVATTAMSDRHIGAPFDLSKVCGG